MKCLSLALLLAGISLPQQAEGWQLGDGAAEFGIFDKVSAWFDPCKGMRDKFSDEIRAEKVKISAKNVLEINIVKKSILEKLDTILNKEADDIKDKCGRGLFSSTKYENLSDSKKGECDEKVSAHVDKLRSCIELVLPKYSQVLAERVRIVDQLKSKLNLKIEDIDKPNESGLTPLIVAIDNNDEPAIKLLLAAGADIEARSTPQSRTPLMVAVKMAFWGESTGAVEKLLAAGANVHAVDNEGKTALKILNGQFVATSQKKTLREIIRKKLIDAGGKD